MSNSEQGSSYEIDATPEPALIFAQQAQNLTWIKALSEPIDNSIDAWATWIHIVLDPRVIEIIDNGKGCPSLEAMVRFGRHLPRVSKRHILGMYGVGLKDAATWIAKELEIATCHDGWIHTTRINWDDLGNAKNWKLSGCRYPNTAAIREQYKIRPEGGTALRFNRVDKQLNVNIVRDLKEQLRYQFTPAIRGGLQLLVTWKGKTEVISAFKLPTMNPVVEDEFRVNGKLVRLHAGVIGDGEVNPMPGYTISYGHRVIKTTKNGCGHYGTARFFAWVELSCDWKLTRNKDDLMRHGDVFYDELFRRCEPILREASSQAMNVHLSGLAHDLTGMFKDILTTQQNKKEQRKPGDEHGTKEPRGTGRTRRFATVVQSGDKALRTKISQGQFKIEFDPKPYVRGTPYGDVDFEASCVTLYGDHPDVKAMTQSDDRVGLLRAAIILYARDAATVQHKKKMQKNFPQFEQHDEKLRFLCLAGLWLAELHTSKSEAEESKIVLAEMNGNQ